MLLDPIPQSLPVHFFGSRPQPPTSRGSFAENDLRLTPIHARAPTHTHTHARTHTRTHTLTHTHTMLQEEYADNPEIINMRTSVLFAEKEVNPLAGCLPILIQFPVFIGYVYTNVYMYI